VEKLEGEHHRVKEPRNNGTKTLDRNAAVAHHRSLDAIPMSFQLNTLLEDVVEELNHYAETGQVHPPLSAIADVHGVEVNLTRFSR
jgi:hypothetical protein